jgi:hypothetical protein
MERMNMPPKTLAVAALALALTVPAMAEVVPVKMSRSGICHGTESPYYGKTQRFTPYESLAQCLAAGGRLPKGASAGHSAAQQTSSVAPLRSIPRYNRDAFPHWSDHDGDCINTRHELLIKQSVSVVDAEWSEAG